MTLKKLSWPWFWLLWVALAGLCFLGLTRGLWTPDEPREAEISREMYLHPGVLPTLNGHPFFEKPPLYYWSVAGLFALTGGPTQAGARAVSGLAALLTLVLTYSWARRAAGARSATWAVFMLATSVLFLYATHWVLLDPLLMLLVTAAGWACDARLAGGRWPYLAVLYCALGLAIWTKGLVGAAPFLFGLALYVGIRWRGRPLARLAPVVGAASLTLATLMVVGAFHLAGGSEAVHQLVWVNHVQRFLHPAATGHVQPFTYYLEALPLAVAPWFVPFLLLFHPELWRRNDGRRDPRLLLACLAGGMVLLLSLPATKREIYILPAMPPLMILTAMAQCGLSKVELEAYAFHRVLYRYVNPLVFIVWGLVLPVALLGYTSPWLGTVLAAAVAASAAIAGWFWASRGSLERAGWAHGACAAIFCLCAILLVTPVLDGTKDMAPFARWLDGELPAGQPVSALGADETLCGIIPFVTGRTVSSLSAQEFQRLARDGRGPTFLLQQGDPRSVPRTDLEGAGYSLVRERYFGPNRYVRLWQVGRPLGGASGAP